MATLALTTLGGAAGSALLPGGLSLFGATLSGAAIGQAVGAIAGNYIDEALFGSSGQSKLVEGARLNDLQVMASTEGAVIPRLYGRARLGGQMIWATRLEEEVIKTSESSGGGKGGLSSPKASTTTKIEYRYYANFAVALCEGEIDRIGRVWADGKELNLNTFTYRLYKGTETQQPDTLIEAKEGSGNVPAYRGLAYIVFDHFALERFGNRIPQMNFEVFRSVDNFNQKVQAVTIIPGAGEFAYDPAEVTRVENDVTIAENTHTRQGGSNWTVAIDDLQDSMPNVATGSLIVSWFGTDLRANHCELKPGIENSEKQTSVIWSAAGETRQTAYTVSQKDGRPAFGGTPSDHSVVAALKDLKARGLKSTFYPFILMDVPDNNSLPDPYTGNTGQPVYPWRGRITIDPAPGTTGTPDKTLTATAQLQSFIGSASVSDFTISGETVIYSGPTEWSLRRMILHYAHLCKAAGGVDAFILSSELRGLTQIRENATDYPFVTALTQLASDVRTILGPDTKITYAADWSEYFGHHPQDGSNDVFFNLDPLWSSPDIDVIGIDLYLPLSDWREGSTHLDYLSGTRSIYDSQYLKNNITGGEGYDWYYSSEADRNSQTRTDITDGQGKPWIFRYKDIKSWWSNPHYNRPGGTENSIPTDWIPQSKPIWFTELGCPAIDKGANQPNVFHDPKSSESAYPYFSLGTRDDTIQRNYIQAILDFFNPVHEDYIADSNPTSVMYAAPMVDLSNIYIYTWDARPYPAFPFNSSAWGDAENWTLGHWITGRIGDAPLAQTVKTILQDFNYTNFDADKLYGTMQGYILDRIMSARDALQPLELSFFMDSFESNGKIRFKHRGHDGMTLELNADQLIETSPNDTLFRLTRRQETELPAISKLSYIDSRTDYRQSAVDVRRTTVNSERVATAQLPIVMEQPQALAMAEIWQHDIWSSRERGNLALPPSQMALEPTDLINLNNKHTLRITEITDTTHRRISALTIEPTTYNCIRTPARTDSLKTPEAFGTATAYFIDLPLLNETDNPAIGYIAANQTPWPGSVAFYKSPDNTGFTLNALATAHATIGKTLTDLSSGPTSLWDFGNQFDVQLEYGQLTSLEDLSLFNGGNLAAVQNTNGQWEVIQFKNAELIAEKTYRLSTLLRGQGGTENYMENINPAGASFILLDDAITNVSLGINDIGLPYNWKYGPANRDIGHSSYSEITHAFSGQSYKPLSPVHIETTFINNNLHISWKRRTRIGGDSWELSEVPLGEEIELYEIEIMDGENVIRLMSSTIQQVTYTEADQLTDWGTIQSSYAIRIYQISATTGRGTPAIHTS